SRAATRCCAAARGRRRRSPSATRSATGTSRSAARSSPGSAVRPTAEPSAAALCDRLAALPLVVGGAPCGVSEVAVPSYPGERRPSSVVTLSGDGAEGSGEHVGWTLAEHERFRDQVNAGVPCGHWQLDAWMAEIAQRIDAPYARAALEAAAIDLALRQQQSNIFRLAGASPGPVRYVVSFERRSDPVAEAKRLLADAPGIELKIDVDPAWDHAVYRALALLGVAVLDFKGSGTAADHARAHRSLPQALLEDPAPDAGPWPDNVQRRFAFDACVRLAADVVELPLRPAARHVKPARMGGVLEALRAIAACQESGVPVYLGGMFEIDVGRRQLHELASLFAAFGPNDVAPIALGDARPERPARLIVDGTRPGFGTARS